MPAQGRFSAGSGQMILRVFPYRTKYIPKDDLVRIGPPDLFGNIPGVTEIHVSVLFTWWREYACSIAENYAETYGVPVKIGGPGMMMKAEDFTPGMYVDNNISFFSRGCPNRCPFCIVPEIEGNKMVELTPRGSGNIIQDNNILAISRSHFRKVCDYLKPINNLNFSGGLDSARLTDWHVEQLRGLDIDELWLACDHDYKINITKIAITKLMKAGFSKRKIRIYCLIGFEGTLKQNESRCREMFDAGGYPFAMLYQPLDGKKKEYSKAWKKMQNTWCRPGKYKSKIKEEKKQKEGMLLFK